MLTRKLVLSASDLGLVKKIIHSPRVYKGLVRRFVAGEDLEEALEEVREIHGRGQSVSLDFLGEKVTD
ncbi:MAG: proline dehydrogenase, partial [Armatimonadia bacterium]|nr:proline dehydrogenase [Armatimonadia bacterium]